MWYQSFHFRRRNPKTEDRAVQARYAMLDSHPPQPTFTSQRRLLQSPPPPPFQMCRTRKSTLASTPRPRSSSTSFAATSASASGASTSTITTSSLSSLRDTLPVPPALYPFPELRLATNNFLSKPHSHSSWRCTLRARDAVLFQRPLRSPASLPTISSRLSTLCLSHHRSVARLLGASLTDTHIYLAYEHTPGASLTDCLRHPRNPGFTPLTTWLSRVQIAADVAQGLEYIHTQTNTVHKHIKSTGIIVTELSFHAKICHFGAADLAGEVGAVGGRGARVEGSRGYMAPELLAGAAISQKSDVFALGVLILELLSGAEPLKCQYDVESGGVERESVVEAAREVIGAEEDEAVVRWGRLRRWVDKRMKDSFPVEVAERLLRVAMKCVETEAGMRPEMTWVAVKVSELLMLSEKWGERVRPPSEISVSLAPR